MHAVIVLTKAYKKALCWLSNDLRLHDNPVIADSHSGAEEVAHVFFLGDALRAASMPGVTGASTLRRQFLLQALQDLEAQLSERSQRLIVMDGRASENLGLLISRFGFDAIFSANHAAVDESRCRHFMSQAYPQISWHFPDVQSIYCRDRLPFEWKFMPAQFTPFRKAIESSSASPRDIVAKVNWSESLHASDLGISLATTVSAGLTGDFQGGERAALDHVDSYFSSDAPLEYKQTRNSLEGFSKSTKFSPWLAQGSLSPLKVLEKLRRYEADVEANDSTYWIWFELLWREFFYWNGLRVGSRLFQKNGDKSRRILNTFYPERYKAWCEGTTPWPIVNAIMIELRETGYITNRARQIAASCFVNELELDWRYGAAYFESQLLDYEPCANWGNWQYQAGVGADPRGKRHFNLEKQADQFDPDETYRHRWLSNSSSTPLLTIDSRDAADWPIS